MQAQTEGGSLLPTHSQLGTRRRCVVNTTLRPLTFPAGIHCTRGLVVSGPVCTVRKTSTLPESDPWTLQPKASRYTDWAISVDTFIRLNLFFTNERMVICTTAQQYIIKLPQVLQGNKSPVYLANLHSLSVKQTNLTFKRANSVNFNI
jgi:hypothetical protein